MRFLSVFLASAVSLTLSTLAQLPKAEAPRSWKTAEGVAFTATLLSFDGTTAVFRTAAGQAKAPLTKLSPEDQAYLAEWQKKQPLKITMPDVVGVETTNLKAEVVSEDPASSKYVYRTEHFEFESQGRFNTTLLREVARNFEATYELVKALPWGIVPQPESGTHFHARLLKDKAAYAQAGGPPNSGGVYKGGGSDAEFLVPFESIGVKTVGKGYAKDDDFDYSTMVHELTHQMMHGSLRLLPQWVVEGTAEYTSTLPLKNGKFRVSAAKNGLKDHIDFLKKRALHGVPEPYPLEQLFNVTNSQWSEILAADPLISRRLYFTSYLLVYYFMHMDGTGDGQRFVRYFREIGEARDAHVRATDDFQKKTLAVLLDGRSEADLMKQIRSAYAKLGIRL